MILEKKIRKVSIDFAKFKEGTMEQFRNDPVFREGTTPEHTRFDFPSFRKWNRERCNFLMIKMDTK